MWFWSKVLASIICMSSLTWVSGCSGNTNGKSSTTEVEKFENLKPENLMLETPNILEIQKWTDEQISICLTTDDENSFTHTNAIEQVSDPENTILEYPVAQLFQKYGNGNRPHPLRVSWVSRNFGALLWNNWIERLISNIPQKLASRSGEITSSTKYEVEDTLRFPLIDPLLKDDFPKYLSDQLKEEGFESFSDPHASALDNLISSSESFQDNNDKKSDFIYDIVVKRAPSWKAALWLYRNWELFMATYVSVWLDSRKTKTWQFKILGKEPYKRSIKYDNAAMPEALSIGDGFFFHQWRVTWGNLSHGCPRVPGVHADVLYSSIRDCESTDVFISKNLYKYNK